MPSALASTTLTNIPPDRYERIQQAADEKIGVGLFGDSGTVQDKGVVISYFYAANETLAIQVLKVPKVFGHDLISPQDVISKVEKAIAGIA